MIGAIIQARMNSSRLPQKVMTKLGDEPLIGILINQLKKIKKLNKIILATTKDKSDDKLFNFTKKYNIAIYRGSIDNVLERYIESAKLFDIKYIIRVCGDTPFIDNSLIENMIDTITLNNCDYVSTEPQIPCVATGIEAFTFEALTKQLQYKLTHYHLEHVSLFIRENNDFNKIYLKPPEYLIRSDIRLTIDTESDLILVKKIFDFFKKKKFNFKDILEYLDKNPDLKLINSHIKQKNVKQKSIKIAFLVKNIDEEVKHNLKKIFTEKNHIGIEIFEIRLNKINKSMIQKLNNFDLVFYENDIKNINLNTLFLSFDSKSFDIENFLLYTKQKFKIINNL